MKRSDGGTSLGKILIFYRFSSKAYLEAALLWNQARGILAIGAMLGGPHYGPFFALPVRRAIFRARGTCNQEVTDA